jgi:Uncharacterized protein conserved in bacteria (DUF2252)
MIAGYLGSTDRFDDALVKYANAYADQAERDYETFQAAIRTGIIYSKGNQSTQYSLGSLVTYRGNAGPQGPATTPLCPPAPKPLPLTEISWTSMSSVSCVGTIGFARVLALSCKSSGQEIMRQGTYGGGVGRFLKNTNDCNSSGSTEPMATSNGRQEGGIARRLGRGQSLGCHSPSAWECSQTRWQVLRFRRAFPHVLCCSLRLSGKILSQDIHADQKHPQREDQWNPFNGSDAQQQHKRQYVAKDRHPMREDPSLY